MAQEFFKCCDIIQPLKIEEKGVKIDPLKDSFGLYKICCSSEDLNLLMRSISQTPLFN